MDPLGGHSWLFDNYYFETNSESTRKFMIHFKNVFVFT